MCVRVCVCKWCARDQELFLRWEFRSTLRVPVQFRQHELWEPLPAPDEQITITATEPMNYPLREGRGLREEDRKRELVLFFGTG